MALSLRAGCCSLQGGYRDDNEDRAAVADGMGGAPAGRQASERAVATLLAHLDKTGRDRVPAAEDEERLRRAFAGAHAQVLGVELPPGRHAGCSATLLYWRRGAERAWIAQLGDTAAYRLRGDRLEQLTQIHDCIGLMAEHEGVSRSEMARRYVWRNVLVYYLGMEGDEFRAPDLLAVPLAAADRFLLCSDGLYNVLGERDMARLLREDGPPQERAERLCRRALDNGSRDNVSAVVVDVL